VLNLMLNAKDAMQDRPADSPRGRIVIASSASDDLVEIRVSDNGAGMTPEVLRKIYDPFFTTKSQPKEGQSKGTGLGLAVTYGIMQEHNGKIGVQSTVGEGTTFTLNLPIAEAPRTRTELEGNAVHA
jgi:two-component system NtrC family sensor kinase